MSLFEKILQTNIINFLIVISTLIFVFKKMKLGLLIDKMAQDVQLKVEESSICAKDALEEYKKTKKDFKKLPEKQKEIIENANNNANNLKEKIEKDAFFQTKQIEKESEKTFLNQQETIKNLTIKEIYLASVNLAQKETIKRLDNNLHKKLINSSIDELDKIQGGLF